MPTNGIEGPARRGTSSADPGETDARVGRRIRERRLLLGLTQARLAGLIGVSHRQVHKYETGAQRISAGRLGAVAAALGVEPGHFFGDDGAVPGDGLADGARLVVELNRSFVLLARRQQEVLCALARALAEERGGGCRARGARAHPAPADGRRGLDASGGA